MEKDQKRKQFGEVVKELAGSFILRESSGPAMITVTDLSFSKDLKNVSLLISVYPEEKEGQVIDFLKRKRSDFKKYVKDNSRLSRIPQFDFKLDLGEKNRQRIDEISKNI